MFCPCRRSQKKWLEEEELVDFMKKDMKKRQLWRINTFSSGEKLFQHAVKANDNGSPVYLRLMHYLSILYEGEIKPSKICKRVSVCHNIQLDITNCYTFCIKWYKFDYDFFTLQKQGWIMFCCNQIFKINYHKITEIMII